MARKWTVIEQLPNGFELVEVQRRFKDDEGVEHSEPLRYEVPRDAGMFQAWISGLDSASMMLTDAFEKWIYGQDLKARADARPSEAGVAEPVIKRKGVEVNLFTGETSQGKTVPLAGRVKYINDAFARAESDETLGLEASIPRAVKRARALLIEAGLVVEKDGMLAAK